MTSEIPRCDNAKKPSRATAFSTFADGVGLFPASSIFSSDFVLSLSLVDVGNPGVPHRVTGDARRSNDLTAESRASPKFSFTDTLATPSIPGLQEGQSLPGGGSGGLRSVANSSRIESMSSIVVSRKLNLVFTADSSARGKIYAWDVEM